MTCSAYVTVTLPDHPVTGVVTETVHCVRDISCANQYHFGWIQAGWLPATSVEWDDTQSGHMFEVVGSQPGEGTIDFICRPVVDA